jgi:hypothetical protein
LAKVYFELDSAEIRNLVAGLTNDQNQIIKELSDLIKMVYREDSLEMDIYIALKSLIYSR